MGEEDIVVAALTQGLETPSARFRVRQFIPALARYGVRVTEYVPASTPLRGVVGAVRRSPFSRAAIPLQWFETLVGRFPGLNAARKSDVTWISKQLVPGLPTLERVLPRPVVLDVDDAMWLARPFGEAAARAAARNADYVVAGSRHLAAYYSAFNANVEFIPTSIDIDRFGPAAAPDVSSAARAEDFVIGWTGSRTTLPFLEALDAPLAAFMERRPSARLLVVCDTPPRFERVPAARVDFVAWSPDNEASILRRMTVGIMPLPDTPLARGKCSFKMLQYMATALPVIVSPVGANNDVLALGEIGWAATTDEEWLESLSRSFEDPGRARAMGASGRQVVEAEFSVEVSARKLARVFRRACSAVC